jgi:hypothetical protein
MCGPLQIATKIEVYVALPGPGQDLAATPFKRLGYLSFDSNERSNHQARELKSVHVNVPALYLRLVVLRCHVNKLNIYNQVCWDGSRSIGVTAFYKWEAAITGFDNMETMVVVVAAQKRPVAAQEACTSLSNKCSSLSAVGGGRSNGAQPELSGLRAWLVALLLPLCCPPSTYTGMDCENIAGVLGVCDTVL